MTEPAMALMTVEISGEPVLSAAADALGVPVSAIDAAFGVVAIDPERNLYAVQVREDALPPDAASAQGVSGPFANPRIEPFGPRKR